MSCFSPSNHSTPYHNVYSAEERALNVGVGQDVTAAYEQFRAALWAVIEVAADAHAFELSWNTLEKFGKAQLLDYQVSGNPDALMSLKECIKAVVENMP